MIVILDNYDSFTYNLYQAVAKIEPDVLVIRNDKTTVSELETMEPEGIIISPGPGIPENAGIGIDVVKQLAPYIPILGVCLGHQIITVAFGGKVSLAQEAVHGKDVLVSHNQKGLYAGMPLPFAAGRYHSLIAERQGLPKDLIVEAESEQGLVMGIRHVNYPTYGVQFHPESILTPEGDRLIKNFIDLCHQKNKLQHE